MQKQPLKVDMDVEDFLNGYYLLEELKAFCRQEGLPIGKGKLDIRNRIAHYLKTKEILKLDKKELSNITTSHTLKTIIVENVRYSESLREFFKQEIDPSFKFTVAFQKWLRANAGKTYADAIEAYKEIKNDPKKTTIAKQFEYNTYIRDFFEDNPGYGLKDAIRCWNYKKQHLGTHKYERSDICVLTKIEK